MRSDDRFIEEIFEKEKKRRTEIKAAKKRAVGICSSLALIFVIGIALPSVMGIFSASKGFDGMNKESAPDSAYDIMADEDAVTGETEDIKNEILNGDENKADKPDYSGLPNEENYGKYPVESEDIKEEPKGDAADVSEEKADDPPYQYIIIGACAALVSVILTVLIIRKKRNSKNNI